MKLLFVCCLIAVGTAIESCGTESPSKVNGCDKVDTDFCGKSCCGIEVTVDNDTKREKVFELLDNYFKTDKDFGEPEQLDPSFQKIEWKNGDKVYSVELSVFSAEEESAETAGTDLQLKFFIASLAKFKGSDNGQNYKLVTTIADGLKPHFAKDAIKTKIEYGCGVKEPGTDKNDPELKDFLKENNLTYEEFLDDHVSGSEEHDREEIEFEKFEADGEDSSDETLSADDMLGLLGSGEDMMGDDLLLEGSGEDMMDDDLLLEGSGEGMMGDDLLEGSGEDMMDDDIMLEGSQEGPSLTEEEHEDEEKSEVPATDGKKKGTHTEL